MTDDTISARNDIAAMNAHLKAFWDLAQRNSGAIEVRGAAFTVNGTPMILIGRDEPPGVAGPVGSTDPYPTGGAPVALALTA